ncbi:MAG TPA: hypothetical protein VGJ05_14635 [Fimbriiglobus sp.]
MFVILLIVVAALFVLFWALSAFFQAYLYNEPTKHLPARAAIAALVVGGLIGVWTYANAKSDRKGKYGPLHDFDSTNSTEVYEFTAVREYPYDKGPDGKPKEVKSTFRRAEKQKSGTFLEDKTGKPFQLNTGTFKTEELEVKEADGKIAHFHAETDSRGNYTPDKRFSERGSKRYVDGDAPEAIYAPSTKAMVYAILLNVLSYVAWLVAFWLIMRFAFAHALGLAVVFGLLTMLVVAPLLFERVRPQEGRTQTLEAPVVPKVINVPNKPDKPKEPGK